MWKTLKCSRQELNLSLVLTCGQSFRWKQSVEDPDIWLGVLKDRLWELKQDAEGNIRYKTNSEKIKKQNDSMDESSFLREYFQLDVDVSKLYEKWSRNDTVFDGLSSSFSGIRILRQDPVENLFSFICSQNNNITRIQKLVEKLCQNYGDLLTTYNNENYYSFPTVISMTGETVEDELRRLGFGYRAKFIHKTAKHISDKTNRQEWLYELRKATYEEAHNSLCRLPGVGPKVADCVCLMSLDKHNAIPVDTHMWQVAARHYLPHLKSLKNITDKAYKEIGDFFREIFGKYAGWAQSVLFSSDLKKFQELKKESKVKDKTKKDSRTLKRTATTTADMKRPSKSKRTTYKETETTTKNLA